MQINTMELALDENFHPMLYLAGNPDLMAEFRKNRNFDIVEHFEIFGKREGRKQVNPAVFEMMATKYPHFKPLLSVENYRFLAKIDSFPIALGDTHLSVQTYPTESANISPGVWTNELCLNPEKLYLDLGAGLRDVVFENCLYLEVYQSITSDVIIAPGAPLPFYDGCLDGVGCFAVLEHVADPFSLASEIKRVVKPGGRVFIDWPFLQPYHGYPSHFYNATSSGIRNAFEDAFEIESVEACEYQSADSTLSWILNWFIDGLEEGDIKEKLLNMTVRELNAQAAKGSFYRDCIAVMSPEMRMKLASGNTLIGRRRR